MRNTTFGRAGAAVFMGAVALFLPLPSHTFHPWYELANTTRALAAGWTGYFVLRFLVEKFGLTLPKRGARATCVVAVVLFVGVYATFAVLRHERLNSSAFDLAIKDQVIWNTAHGRPFELSLRSPSGKYMCYLGDHFSPIFAVFVPFYWLWEDVRWLLILQPVILACGVYPLWQLARRAQISDWAATAFAAVFLCYPALGFLCRFDFHQLVFVVPFFLYAFYFAERNKPGAASVFLLLAMLCKEEVGLTVFAFGLYQCFGRRRRQWGALWALAGVAGSVFIVFYAMPAIRGCESEYFGDLYGYLGQTSGDVASTALHHPARVLRALAEDWPEKLAYLLKLPLPLGGICLRGAGPALIMFPALAYTLLSRRALQYSIYFQYAAIMVPFIFLSAGVALRRMADKSGNPVPRSKATLRLCALWLAFTTAAWWADCPFTKTIGWPKYHEVYALERHSNAKEFRHAASLIPPDASLGTTMAFAPHLSHRRDIRVITMGRSKLDEGLDYYLLDLGDFRWTAWTGLPNSRAAQKMMAANILRVLREGTYEQLYYRNKILLLRRKDGGAR